MKHIRHCTNAISIMPLIISHSYYYIKLIYFYKPPHFFVTYKQVDFVIIMRANVFAVTDHY